jgi:S-methylmethionine-dependent homocysteine/selenocysteine methylase
MMEEIDQLHRRLTNGEVIVIDGGMGTELEARGAPMNHEAWCGIANLEHPNLVRDIHEDYIRAGADVIITNTYPTSRAPLEAAGYGDKVVQANRAAVELALEARDRAADRPVVIAGSMSIWGHGEWFQDGVIDRAELLNEYREQATILAQSGVDLIVLEMFSSRWPEGFVAAVETGLDVWLGFWVDLDDAGAPIAYQAKRPLQDELHDLLAPGVAAVTIMHSELGPVLPGLEVIAREWDGPRGAYPHVGDFERPRWVFHDITPEAMADEAQRWVDQGSQLVGGCCGIRPGHIKAISDRVRPVAASPPSA